MRIADVSAFGLSSPVSPPQERRYHGGTRTILKRDLVVLLVETATGLQGVGTAGASSSAMREYFENASHQTIVDVIEDIVAPALVGTDIDAPEEIHGLLGSLALPEALEVEIASALDVALYDLLGKQQGAPIYKILNEEADDAQHLEMYASGGMYMPPEEYAAEASALQRAGFTGYKYRPGLGPEEDRRTIRLIREAVGEEMKIMVDAHTWWKMGPRSYSLSTVQELVGEFMEYGVYWVEEPVPPEAYDKYIELFESTGAPLAGGESETPTGLRELAATESLAYLQGDVRHHRGFTGCWEVVERCQRHGCTYVPHHFGSHIGLVANAHIVAAGTETNLTEYPAFETEDHPGMYPFPLATDIIAGEIKIEDGTLTMPSDPGLGISVNMDALDRYEYIDGPWTEFRDESAE